MPPSPSASAALGVVEALVRQSPIVLTQLDSGLVDDEAAYLAFHRVRFLETLRRIAEAVPPGVRILDAGAQFLHASMALCEMGYQVDAADVAPYAAEPRLVSRAKGHLRVHGITSLAQTGFSDATFEAVLLLEVLEHLTENPRPIWAEVARVLKPGGRAVVTTPNLYRIGGGGGAALQALRLITGRGMGPTVDEVLTLHSGAHHWKEYGRRELRRYFSALGWRIERTDAFNYVLAGQPLFRALKRVVPALRDCLYLEIVRA